MREILFRGKKKNSFDWAEGFYVMHSVSIEYPYSYTNGKHCIQTVPHNIQYEVDPETVCQYTGLTDKNGRKIFENDILEFTASDDCKSNYIIFWNEVEWSIRETKLDAVDDCRYWNQDEWEVIGNIFDNPELIGEESPVKWKEHLMSKFSEVV